jgi:acetolactate synthase-1/3 small subunit
MKHTISITVQENFNALSRIVGLFSGRGFSISSISFGGAEEPGLARVTITAAGDERIIEQIT